MHPSNVTAYNVSMTNGTKEVHPTDVEVTIQIVALCTVMVSALVFNSLVIAVFLKNPSLQKTVNYFLVNMAVCDLLCPIVAIPKRLVVLITGMSAWQVSGTLGMVMCKVQPLLQDLSPAVSILSIVCITVDRFYAVMRPLRISLIPDKARGLIIALIWILAILSYSHYFSTLKLKPQGDGRVYCIMDWSPLDNIKSLTILTTYIGVLYGFLPWVLVIVLYVIIMAGLRRAKARIQANGQTLIRHRRIASVTRQAFIIVIVFALCNFPQAVVFLMIAYYFKFGYSPFPYFMHLHFAAEFMVYANAALNPCICLFLNENYRHGLWRLLRIKRSDRIIHPDVLREEIPIENMTRST